MPQPKKPLAERAKRLSSITEYGGRLPESAVYGERFPVGDVEGHGFHRSIDEEHVAAWALPLLDDTPLTAEWIDSLGFTKGDMPFGGGTLSIYAKYDGGCNVAEIEIRNDADWYGCNHTIDLPLPHTRGQLRLVALALGIELKG